ncbi:YSIRK-type signal peptide-containing protein [Limosilactobacillus allomucosae]|uniref:YSIRK-type signal peptide-containing protein n=1 Tax=Limosilactobacillus allomucosae TaxID=3142938 RepID=A0AAU7C1A5_9LACO
MVGKNNNYVRESKSNEHFQRFALRKLSVGVVSVAVAAGFYLGSGTTAQAATTEPDASAKTEQVVQQDANSTASETASASNSSAAVSTSSATPVSAESASSMAVSDSPASASAASDNQASSANASESSSQSASSSVASDAAAIVSKDSQAASEANSQSAADTQTAQLPTSAANANESQAANILSAQVVQQAANQQAPAGFTVTDPTYPAGMYQDTDASHYTYWWAQSSDGEYNLVLSTDRNGDGKVYVFLLGRNNNVLDQYTVDKNKSTEVATDDEGDFGTVYNDGQSGVFVSSDGTWKSKFNVFDPNAGEDNGNYGSISFMIPQVETQTTTYVDSKDKTISDSIVQKGLDGQIYTTQGGKVLGGYFAKEPSNANGYMSPFGKQGATYTKNWHDGLKATFTETDTKTGLMHVVVKYHYFLGGWQTVKEFDLAPGQSKKVDYDFYKSVTIHSIYIPQTINIQYVYEKLGNLIIDSDSKAFPAEDKTTTQYPNDENDSTKAGNVTILKVPGFTPTINGKTVTNYTFNPADYVSDLSKDINVVYVADTQEAAINFYDETDQKQLDDQTIHLTGKTGEKVDRTQADKTLTELEKQGYVLDKENTKLGFPTDVAYDNDDAVPQEFTIYLKHDTQDVSDTDKEAKTTATRTINVTTPDGKTNSVKQEVNYKRTATKDLVNGHITYGQWQADGASAWEEYTPTPQKGYTTLIDGAAGTKVVQKTPAFKDDKPVNETVNVTYQADAQEAAINFYDETDHKLLDKQTVHLTGKTGEKVDRTQADKTLAELEKQGYVLDEDNTKLGFPADVAYDNDDAKPQEFTIYLEHGTTHTSATDEKANQKTVTETIHYVYKDGIKAGSTAAEDHTDSVTFKRGYTTDNVTHKIVSYDPWTVDGKQADNKTFDAVKSPAIAGYTADVAQVDATTVTPDSENIVKTVNYTADSQEAAINFYDETGRKLLDNQTIHLTGKTGEKVDRTKADQTLAELKNQGYVLDEEKTKLSFPANAVYDNDDAKPQEFTIYLEHGTTHTDATDKNAEQKIVTETIHYVYENNQTAKPDYTSAVDFKRGYTTDNVTGKVVSYDPWTVSSKKFGVVKSPAIEGYTPNHSQIDEITVTPDSKDVVKTVVYVGNAQEAQAIFYDETAGKEIDNTREIATGKTDETISFAKDPNEVVKELEAKGYVFDKDNANNNVFVAGTAYDKNSEVHQYFKYYLKHGHAAVTPDQDSQNGQTTVTQTIKYEYADGTATGLADNVQTLTFKRTGDKDLVTRKVTWPDWSTVAGQQTSAVTSPDLKGYTADTSEIPAVTYHAGDSDVTYVVKYSADAQRAVIEYIDGETGKDLQEPDTVDGHTNETIPYSTAATIKKYEDQGYELFKDNFPAGEKFDNDDANDQNYTVVFKHHRENVDPNHSSADGTKGTKTLTETVHYKYANGTTAAEDQTAQVTFTRNGVLDDVTGIVAWGKWNEASQSYKALTSPTIAGYTPSETVVKRSSNSDAEQGPTLTVIYTADAQKVHVQYIDGETDQLLRQDDLDGYTDETIPYSTAATIKKYEDQGYELFKDNFPAGEKFDNDDANDQNYTVVFKHHRENVDPNHSSADGTKGTKTLTETVHYKYADGTTAAEDQTAQVTFTRNGVLDDVTGIVAWGKWNEASQSYKALTSPTIAGYTPSETVVKRSSNSDAEQGPTLTVVYTADAQKVHVQYIDDTTGKTLRQDDLHGYTDETIPYSTAEGIKKFEGDGYVLVSDGFKPGTKFGVGTPTYEVHFKHGTTHTSATDENADQKTVTETIHYVDENNQTVQPDYTAAVTFKRGYTTDNVTGKVVSYDPWTLDGKQADSKTFAAVTSPVVEGYTPNHQQINEFTVTPDSKDIVKTVVYVGDPQEAQAIFYDETTGKEISNTREFATGKTDETISFTKDPNEVVKELEKQGYVFDKDNANNNVFVAGTTYDKNSEVHQYFKYYFTHATTIVTPDNPKTPADVLPDNPGKNYPSGVAKDDLNKTITRTINITTPDGKTQTITQKAEFTRSATVDEVTGEVTYGPWSKNVVLESVDVPNIPGYVPSASVPEITVTPNDQDTTINITYKKLDSGKAADQGGNASNGGSTTGQAAQNGQSGQTQNNAGAQQLPQTGNANNEKGALGLAGAMFAAGLGLGFGSKKKRHEN